MKLYYAMFVCAASAALAVALALHSGPVAAETHAPAVAQQQLSELVSMAIPPYKW